MDVTEPPTRCSSIDPYRSNCRRTIRVGASGPSDERGEGERDAMRHSMMNAPEIWRFVNPA
jgi:hypothetical protein